VVLLLLLCLRGPLGAQEVAPNFALRSLEGKYLSLISLRGRVVVLNFWASWCPACKRELPLLAALQRELGPRGLSILGITTESRRALRRFFRARGRLPYPVLLDRDSRVHRLYGVFAIPTTVVLDKDGLIRKRFLGEFDPPELRRSIRRLLQ